MGSLQLWVSVGSDLVKQKITMNKFLAILCLGAGVLADADPYYAAYGYSGLAGYAGYPYAGAYGAYPYGLGYAAGYASVSPSAAVSINGLAPAALPALAGGYAGAGRYVANSAGVVHVAKREAEAEADPYYANYGYAGLGYAGAYGLGYAGAYGAYPYGLGYGYGGYANLGASGAVNIAGLAPAAAPAVAGGYAAAGRYCASSAGVVHCA